MRSQLIKALLVVSTASVVYGQSSRPLIERFDRAIRTVYADAKVDGVRERVPGDEGLQEWRFHAGVVSARHSVYPTFKEASESLELSAQMLPLPTRMVEGIGDAAYLVFPMDGAPRHLTFRRGRVIVEVVAPNEESVRRFAALLAAEVNQAIRSGDIQER